MPQMSEGGEFKLRLHYFRAWHEHSDLMQALDHLIHDLNLIPLYNEYKHDGMAGTKTLPAGEFASYIMQSYQTRDDWDRENFLGAFFESRTAALFRPPFVHTGAQFLPLSSDIPIHSPFAYFRNEFIKIPH